MAWVQLDSYFCFKRHQTLVVGGGRKQSWDMELCIHSRQVGKKTVQYQLSIKTSMPFTKRWLHLGERWQHQGYFSSYWILTGEVFRAESSALLILGPAMAPTSILPIYLYFLIFTTYLPPSLFPYSMVLLFGFCSSSSFCFEETLSKIKNRVEVLWFQTTFTVVLTQHDGPAEGLGTTNWEDLTTFFWMLTSSKK